MKLPERFVFVVVVGLLGPFNLLFHLVQADAVQGCGECPLAGSLHGCL